MGEENDLLGSTTPAAMSGQQPTKLNVNIDAMYEGGKEGGDLFYQVYGLAVVLARRIPMRSHQFWVAALVPDKKPDHF